ncbi:hypothetical protein LTR53_019550, partial [Teratosphaeriaceae sp. CCFEE 6253]
MDERRTRTLGTSSAAEGGPGSAASLGFSRFKTLEMVRVRCEEEVVRRKAEAERAAGEKRGQDEAVAAARAQQVLQQQQQAKLREREREVLAAQQLAQQQQQQGGAGGQAGAVNALAQKQALLHAQRAQLAQQRDAQIAAAVAVAGRDGH